MTTATRHIETDPLAALREELLSAAGRRTRSRRRIRRAVVVAALAAGLLAATAATAAIGGFSTGVPAVDDLIGVEGGPRGLVGLPAGSASEPLAVKMGDGTYQMVAYLTQSGDICVVFAERHRGGVRGGGGGCPPVEDVSRQVERRGAAWQGSSHGLDQRTNQYLVDGEVETISPQGDGDWKVLMTPPWTPDAPGARPLRLAVVIDDADLPGGEDGLQPGELPVEAYDEPVMELTYSDGSARVYRGRQAK
jgi:hypothetical protein